MTDGTSDTTRAVLRWGGTAVALGLALWGAGCDKLAAGVGEDAAPVEPQADQGEDYVPEASVEAGAEVGRPKSCCEPGDPTWLDCQDALWCDGTETCNCWGECEPGPPRNCDDGDPLTIDTCTEGPPPGCIHTGTSCTTDAGCDDGNPCTTDACSSGACIHTPVTPGTDCDDGTWCNGPAACSVDGICQPGIAPCPLACETCNETAHRCDIAADTCLITGACYDNGATNPSDQCEWCQPSVTQTNWRWKPPGARCDDGLFCTLTDTCDGAHVCTGTGERCPSLGCVDGCDEAAGRCNLAPSGTVCRTSTGVCDPGEVCDGASPMCPPNDFSTTEGLPCNDGDDCTEDDMCVGGACAGTPPPLGCTSQDMFVTTNGGETVQSTHYGITISVGTPQPMMQERFSGSYWVMTGPAGAY